MPYGSGIADYFPQLTWQCDPRVSKVVEESPHGGVILDMGAGGRRAAPNIVTVDAVQCGDTDVVTDVCATPFDDDYADLIIATGLIEHLEDDDAFLAEAHRVLKTGGRIHIEVPFMQQYHDDPIDSRRYTVQGLERLLQQHGFQTVTSGCHIGPSVAIATLNAYYAAMLFEGDGKIRKIISNGAFYGVSLMLWPLTKLDKWLQHRRSAPRLAFGVYCTARKSAA